MGDPVALVVHGHFYQPPREDPWTGEVPEQPSAAPFHDWNERITDESYRPITEVEVDGARVNVLEHMSFNVGPTLLSWLAEHHPDVYERFIDADRRTGRAIAQAYGHAILPLCNDRDLRTQVRWGLADFRHRFGRAAEGMWLPETAVSERVLAVLAEEGVRFTILAPTQLRAVRPLEGEDGWEDLAGEHGEAIALRAPTGPTAGATPPGPTSPSTSSCTTASSPSPSPSGTRRAEDVLGAVLGHAGEVGGMVAVATDGETFGHHKPGADRMLGHALVVRGAGPRRRGAPAARPPRRATRHPAGRRAHRARGPAPTGWGAG